MRKLTIDNLFSDLTQWAAAEAVALNEVVSFSKNGGWEQWCVVQFLRWQLHQGNAAQGLNFEREWNAPGRRYDIAYNTANEADVNGYPIILTQWKALKDGISYDVFGDIGTLTEIEKHMRSLNRTWQPVIVGLTLRRAEFPGAKALPNIPASNVQLFVSSDATWQPFRNVL